MWSGCGGEHGNSVEVKRAAQATLGPLCMAVPGLISCYPD
jgi:hypothetical protein